MSQRRRVLIFLEAGVYVRNFVTSGAMDSLRKTFDCRAVVPENLDASRVKEYFPIAGVVKSAQWRQSLCLFRMYLTMWAYRHRSTSFPLKFQADYGGRKLRFVCYLLGLPVLAPLTIWTINMILGENQELNAILDQEKPELVLIPCMGSDLSARDLIVGCRKRGIATLLLINGWDNLSTRGILTDHPDYIGVWGEEAKEHGLRIQQLDGDRIFILGVPHFEGYRIPPAPEAVQRIREIHHINEGNQIILLSGCSRDVGELILLDKLEEAIERGDLKNYQVIYRPHPWGHAVGLEEKFYEKNYRHVVLDAQIAASYETILKRGVRRHSGNFQPDLSYYPALIESADCVISPLSTFLIEAAVMNKPALAVAFSGGPSIFPLEKIIGCEHFKYLKTTNGIMTCREPELFIADLKKLIAFSTRPDIRAVLANDIRHIVFRDDVPYSEHLLAAACQILGQPLPHPAGSSKTEPVTAHA